MELAGFSGVINLTLFKFNVMKIIKWYIEVWADMMVQSEKRGIYLSYNERVFFFLLSTSMLRVVSLLLLASFVFNLQLSFFSTEYTSIKKINALINFLLMFLPSAILDYLVVFYKKRYLKYTENRSVRTNGKLFIYLLVVAPFVGIIFAFAINLLFLGGKFSSW